LEVDLVSFPSFIPAEHFRNGKAHRLNQMAKLWDRTLPAAQVVIVKRAHKTIVGTLYNVKKNSTTPLLQELVRWVCVCEH
jgi:hypothetical protein